MCGRSGPVRLGRVRRLRAGADDAGRVGRRCPSPETRVVPSAPARALAATSSSTSRATEAAQNTELGGPPPSESLAGRGRRVTSSTSTTRTTMRFVPRAGGARHREARYRARSCAVLRFLLAAIQRRLAAVLSARGITPHHLQRQPMARVDRPARFRGRKGALPFVDEDRRPGARACRAG